MKDLLQSKEAADFLGISKSKLYKLTMQRLIPHKKLFGRLCFDAEELERWRDEKMIEVRTVDDLEKEAENVMKGGKVCRSCIKKAKNQ